MDIVIPIHMQGSKIDLAHLNRMAGGDKDLMIEVLSLFREQSEMWKKLLDSSQPTNDWLIGAHTIKGSARGIGAWELGEICSKAEEAALSHTLTKDEKYIWREQIIQCLEDAMIEIADIEHKIKMDSLKS